MASTFQIRHDEDRYPISRYTAYRARILGLSRSDLALRLGYRDLSKAHKLLGEMLKTGVVPAHMRKHLASALELDAATVDAVLQSASRQQEDEWRARLLVREQQYAAEFQPHLRTETERTVPQPIFIAALVGTARLRFVKLPPEIWKTNADDRQRLVQQAIRDDYRHQRGHVPAFGAIRSYTLVMLPGYLVDFGYPFDTDGYPTGPLQAVNRIGSAALGLKQDDTRLTGLLRNVEVARTS